MKSVRLSGLRAEFGAQLIPYHGTAKIGNYIRNYIAVVCGSPLPLRVREPGLFISWTKRFERGAA